MPDKLDIHFQVFQTSVHVVYGDLMEFEADAVVSTDDVHFSAASGISQYICEKAGKSMIRRELRKYVPPSVPVGSVVVTSAGMLRAKHVFHAAVLDFRPINPYILIQKVTKQVIDLANALGVEKVITPSFLTHDMGLPGKPHLVNQLIGLPEVQVLDFVLRNLAYHLTIAPEPISLRDITIVLNDKDAGSTELGEQLITEDLAGISQEIRAWSAKLDPVNKWVIYLKPLIAALQDSNEYQFREFLEEKLTRAQTMLRDIFINIEKSKEIEGSIFNEKTIENCELTEKIILSKRIVCCQRLRRRTAKLMQRRQS